MILGIGNAQVDAILYCRHLGLEIHACSSTDYGAGLNLVTHFSRIDIADVNAVTDYAREHQVNYVYSIGSDMAMPTVAAVSESLVLPHFVSWETALVCQNKVRLRSDLGTEFFGNIPFLAIEERGDIEKWHEYPCVLKPSDSQGQRGVRLLKNQEDFFLYYEETLKYSLEGKVIIEKFIYGPEISLNIYLMSGKIIFSQISDRISFQEYPGGIIKEHHMPSLAMDSATEDKVLSIAQRVVRKLAIKEGPVYFQMKLEHGEPRIIEVAPRLDGCHLWRLIKYHRNVDLLAMTFQHLIFGRIGSINTEANEKTSYCLKFICEKPGHKVKKVIMLGAGGFAREVLDTIDIINKHTDEAIEPIGFVYDNGNKDAGKLIHGIPVLGELSHLKKVDLNEISLVAAVGRPVWRRKMVTEAKKLGGSFMSLIHPTATISKRAKIGEGAIIMRYGNIQSGAVIGDFFSADAFASIGHDVIFGDFVHMSPRVATVGGAIIGNNVFLGIRSTILNVSVGDGSVVGACALVNKDMPPNMIARGVPAKFYEIKEKEY